MTGRGGRGTDKPPGAGLEGDGGQPEPPGPAPCRSSPQTGCCGCSPAPPGPRRTTPAMTTPCTSAASRPPAAASSRPPTAPSSCGSSRAPEPGWPRTSDASPAGPAPGSGSNQAQTTAPTAAGAGGSGGWPACGPARPWNVCHDPVRRLLPLNGFFFFSLINHRKPNVGGLVCWSR